MMFKMKKFLLSFAALIIFYFCADAQKVAYIDTEVILEAIPEYQAAQIELNELSDKYKATLEAEIGEIDELYQTYQQIKHSLTASQRTAMEQEIISKEQVVKSKQRIYFGEDGIMAKKSEELIGPIQARVNSAIETIANMDDYAIIIDLAITPGVVYKNSRYDLTERVLQLIQITDLKNIKQ
jgi:outer membrane protein